MGLNVHEYFELLALEPLNLEREAFEHRTIERDTFERRSPLNKRKQTEYDYRN